jgi:uncharacterized membrane protein
MVWRGRCFAVKVARLPRSWLPLSVVAAAVAGVMLVVDGVVNRACFTSHGACISDLSTLYQLRGLPGHAFPYVHAGNFGLPRGTVEYPVLTGLFAWLTALPAQSQVAFVVVSAVLLGVVTVVTATALTRAYGVRALLFVAYPALAVTALQNWDLLVVATTAFGLLAWVRGRRTEAAVWFTVGTFLKLYPLLFLLVLLADSRARADNRLWRKQLLATGTAAAAINGYFVIAHPHEYWQIFQYQSARPLDISAVSVWSLFATHLEVNLANVLSLAATVLGFAIVLAIASRRVIRGADFPFVQTCAAAAVVYLVTAKSCSPQCMLWLAPFFVLLDVRVRWWLATGVVAVVSTVVIDHVLTTEPEVTTITQSSAVVAVVLVRAALLLLLIPVFMRSSLARVRSTQVEYSSTPGAGTAAPVPAAAVG